MAPLDGCAVDEGERTKSNSCASAQSDAAAFIIVPR
jgi:hypothetical protein